jgi:shikimate kinase
VTEPVAATADHVVLVGMMGVGKSTVGRRMAVALDRPFRDTDAEIEQRSGRAVAEIFATDGEPAFRSLESEVLRALVEEQVPSVIAAAGGVVLSPVNRTMLVDAGLVVWLKAPVEVLLGRVRNGTHRPALADDPRGALMQMESARQDLYAEVADVVVDSSLPIAAVVSSILDAVALSRRVPR